MKFFGLLTIAAAVLAEVVQQEAQVGEEAPYAEIKASYIINEFPELAPTDVAHLINSEGVTLNYTIVNLGPEMKLIGVGGSFKDPKTDQIVSNLTAARIGPYDLGEKPVNIHQQVVPNLEPADYILSPELFVLLGDQVLQYRTRMQVVNIADKPISIFDPRLLVLELLLVAGVAGAGWFAYTTLVAKQTSAKPVASKQFDKSWIPEAHIKKKSKKVD